MLAGSSLFSNPLGWLLPEICIAMSGLLMLFGQQQAAASPLSHECTIG